MGKNLVLICGHGPLQEGSADVYHTSFISVLFVCVWQRGNISSKFIKTLWDREQGKMGCVTGLGRCILIFLNTIVVIFGLLLLACGVVGKVSSDLFNSQLKVVADYITKLPGALNINAGSPPAGSELVADLKPYIDGASTALIIVGSFVLLLGMFGCCGACCKIKTCLILYVVILLILLLAQIALVVMYLSGKVSGYVKTAMKSSITEEYGGIDKFDVTSVTWNVIMFKLQCCGVDGYQDFSGAKKWNPKRTDDTSGITVQLATPMACCILQGTFPNVQPKDKKCALSTNPSSNNYDVGCYQEIVTKFKSYRTMSIVITFAVLAIQVLLIIFAILVAKEQDSDD